MAKEGLCVSLYKTVRFSSPEQMQIQIVDQHSVCFHQTCQPLSTPDRSLDLWHFAMFCFVTSLTRFNLAVLFHQKVCTSFYQVGKKRMARYPKCWCIPMFTVFSYAALNAALNQAAWQL